MAKLLMLFGLLFVACGDVNGSWSLKSSTSDGDSSSSDAISSNSVCLDMNFVDWQTPPSPPYFYGLTEITLSAYLISANIITQGQYKAIMGENPSKGEKNDMFPVDGVTWRKAVEFCEKLSEQMCLSSDAIKLPTEAQWVYATEAMRIRDGYWEWTNDCHGTFPASQYDPSPVDCIGDFARVVKGTLDPDYRAGIPPNWDDMGIGGGYIGFRVAVKNSFLN